MAPMKQENLNHSSNYGEGVVRQADVLASCYIVDPSAALKGLHYCTTSLTGKGLPHCLALVLSTHKTANKSSSFF